MQSINHNNESRICDTVETLSSWVVNDWFFVEYVDDSKITPESIVEIHIVAPIETEEDIDKTRDLYIKTEFGWLSNGLRNRILNELNKT